MKVKVVAALIRRSMDTEVETYVPVHELDILRLIHGGDAVQADDASVGEMELEAVPAERMRLERKYGFNEQGVPYVQAVYAGDSALQAAMASGQEKPKKQQPKQQPKKQGNPALSSMKVDELKAYLTENNQVFAEDASYDDLLAQAQAFAAAQEQ